MIPVFQTVIDPQDGNCMQACVASVLEWPLEAVPHFPPKSGNQLAELRKWLKPYGLAILALDVTGPRRKQIAARLPIGTVMMISGASKSFEGGRHVVVGEIADEAGECIITHDPNPNALGLGDVYFYYFFIPTNPALYMRRRLKRKR